MLIVFFLFLFVFGAVLASFGGVIIERSREESATLKSVFGGRSFCPGCKQTLLRRQLIPIGGWLLQKGKCIRCGTNIPAWYVWTELIMGAVFVFTGWWVTQGDMTLLAESLVVWKLLFRLVLNRGLVMLIVADLFRYELNLHMRGFLLLCSLAYQVMIGWEAFGHAIAAGMVLAALFAAIYLAAARRQTKKQGVFTEGFGLGDVFMAGLLGSLAPLVIDLSGGALVLIQLVLVYLVLSSGLGIVFRVGRKYIFGDSDDHMPFIPAMIITFRIFFLWRSSLAGYLNLL